MADLGTKPGGPHYLAMLGMWGAPEAVVSADLQTNEHASERDGQPADARPWVHRLGLRNELFLLLLREVIEALGDKVGMQICGGVDADVASGQVLQAILSSSERIGA